MPVSEKQYRRFIPSEHFTQEELSAIHSGLVRDLIADSSTKRFENALNSVFPHLTNTFKLAVNALSLSSKYSDHRNDGKTVVAAGIASLFDVAFNIAIGCASPAVGPLVFMTEDILADLIPLKQKEANFYKEQIRVACEAGEDPTFYVESFALAKAILLTAQDIKSTRAFMHNLITPSYFSAGNLSEKQKATIKEAAKKVSCSIAESLSFCNIGTNDNRAPCEAKINQFGAQPSLPDEQFKLFTNSLPHTNILDYARTMSDWKKSLEAKYGNANNFLKNMFFNFSSQKDLIVKVEGRIGFQDGSQQFGIILGSAILESFSDWVNDIISGDKINRKRLERINSENSDFNKSFLNTVSIYNDLLMAIRNNAEINEVEVLINKFIDASADLTNKSTEYRKYIKSKLDQHVFHDEAKKFVKDSWWKHIDASENLEIMKESIGMIREYSQYRSALDLANSLQQTIENTNAIHQLFLDLQRSSRDSNIHLFYEKLRDSEQFLLAKKSEQDILFENQSNLLKNSIYNNEGSDVTNCNKIFMKLFSIFKSYIHMSRDKIDIENAYENCIALEKEIKDNLLKINSTDLILGKKITDFMDFKNQLIELITNYQQKYHFDEVTGKYLENALENVAKLNLNILEKFFFKENSISNQLSSTSLASKEQAPKEGMPASTKQDGFSAKLPKKSGLINLVSKGMLGSLGKAGNFVSKNPKKVLIVSATVMSAAIICYCYRQPIMNLSTQVLRLRGRHNYSLGAIEMRPVRFALEKVCKGATIAPSSIPKVIDPVPCIKLLKMTLK